MGAKTAKLNARKKPDNRLTLTEFLGCLVRISFLRANPKHGQYDNTAKLVELPGCLKKMLEDVVIPNAKQDVSSLFREEVRDNAAVQAVFAEYKEKLVYYYNEVNQLTALKGKADNKLSMETWMDICRGYLHFAKRKGMKHMEKSKSSGGDGTGGLGEGAFVGDCTVCRESDITGDERCKEKFTCRLSTLEAKFAFLNSQSLEQMAAGEASENDAMATLDFDEFIECLRGARARQVWRDQADDARRRRARRHPEYPRREVGRGGHPRCDVHPRRSIRLEALEAAQRADADGAPQVARLLAEHRDRRPAPLPALGEGRLRLLQEAFGELTNIFAHYSKSVGGSTTAEDAVEMTMGEFKDFVKDTGLETKVNGAHTTHLNADTYAQTT